jgi:hypothetical protein
MSNKFVLSERLRGAILNDILKGHTKPLTRIGLSKPNVGGTGRLYLAEWLEIGLET